ncbi:MAG TPA: flagellar motor switch protein FliM, partial [bacterium]|nr:flagellar motor switch protein FliM [bacterium]
MPLADILSQEEIDALLSALSSGEVAETEVEETPTKTKLVKTWDFRRPDRFSKDQTRTLQMLHEQFARYFSGLLSMHLRSLVEVKLTSVDQLTYDEFIRSLPNPTCLAILNMTPLEGQAMLEISPVISFSFVDRMMGGQGAEFTRNRELTEIEQAL